MLLFVLLLAQHLPEPRSLNKVLISHFLHVPCRSTYPFLVSRGSAIVNSGVLIWFERRRVVGNASVVAVNGGWAVALKGVECMERRIDRKLLVIDTEL